MDDKNNLQKALDRVFAKMDFIPADPAEHYAEQIRERFRKAYQEGLIDCIPKVTGHFDKKTGDLTAQIEFPPKEVDSIQFNLTYDGEKFSY